MDITIHDVTKLANETSVGDEVGFYKHYLNEGEERLILGVITAKYEHVFMLKINGEERDREFTWKDYLLGYVY